MHAAWWRGLISTSLGVIAAQSAIAYWHLVLKWQPDGGSIGDGTSPFRIIRSRFASTSGSGTGTAEIRALVYGMSGSR